jgi:predicted site-specific integrase-resolvase
MRKLLSTEDVSQILGVPIGTLHVWRHRQFGPPSFKVGGLIRYEEDGVEDFLNESRRSSLRGASV